MKRAFRLNQLVWWGEFVARVTAIGESGQALSIQGGPVLGDGSFDPARLRPLGIGGWIRISAVWLLTSPQIPRWLKLIVQHDCCGICGRWTPQLGKCSRCGEVTSWKHGASLYGLWITLYMKLWLSKNPTISKLGRWLWCNDWRDTLAPRKRSQVSEPSNTTGSQNIKEIE